MGIFSSTMNILLMIFGFGLLIFIHELGHFLAAKWANIRTEGFAIGMGPVLFAWRKGIGLKFGSTEHAYLKLAEQHIRSDGNTGELTRERVYEAADQLGLGETEYSLRILPIGGFVKMLGQEDANPAATSNDPRSYNLCPVGKRMVVVSAGVIMNLILAAVLFMIVFSVGVPFEAATVGDVLAGSPAANVVAQNADALRARGVDPVGLKPADDIVSIDGSAAQTFVDVQIAAAMSTPDEPIAFVVHRNGVDEPLRFNIEPTVDPITKLRSVGIMPPQSATIEPKRFGDVIREELGKTGLLQQGVVPGATIQTANGLPVTTYHQVLAAAQASNGVPVASTWLAPDGSAFDVNLAVLPEYQLLAYATKADDGVREGVLGLLGFVPPTRIVSVTQGGPSQGVLMSDDVIAQLEDMSWPRQPELKKSLQDNAGRTIQLRVLRAGTFADLTLKVRRDGTIGVLIGYATKIPRIASPMSAIGVRDPQDATWSSQPTALADADVIAGSEVLSVNDRPVTNWPGFREGLQHATEDAFQAGEAATVRVKLRAPNKDRDEETIELTISPQDVRALHDLGWELELPAAVFAPVMTVRSSHGNPIHALVMGVEETWKVMIQTYLTFDRLFRGTIGVEQLRGPVGIVHLGYQIADRGVLYLLFLLAAISVNLAVINFLPLPIVDGGLFLFLVYEKFKGKPPSIGFQNIATLAGLAMIISVFLFVTWNDVMRIVG